jgi:hypothetical protein
VVAIDISDVLAGLLARNRGPDPGNPDVRKQPDYGVAASIDGNALSMVLAFRRDAAYCCPQWGCHLALANGRRWDPLRQALAARGIAVPDQIRLQVSCIVEEGAVFFDLFRPDPARRGWYAFEKVEAHHYEASAIEAISAQAAEQNAAADKARGLG